MTIRSPVTALLVAWGASAVLVASAHAGPGDGVERLADGRWRLAEIRGGPRFPHHPADIFQFDGKGLRGKIGCNWIGASAILADGVVTYAEVVRTTLSCRIENDPHESGRFHAVESTLDGGHVARATPRAGEIVSRDGETVLVFRRLGR